jgi:hypothetical protein
MVDVGLKRLPLLTQTAYARLLDSLLTVEAGDPLSGSAGNVSERAIAESLVLLRLERDVDLVTKIVACCRRARRSGHDQTRRSRYPRS